MKTQKIVSLVLIYSLVASVLLLGNPERSNAFWPFTSSSKEKSKKKTESNYQRAKRELSEFYTGTLFPATYSYLLDSISMILDKCYQDKIYYHEHENLTEAIRSLLGNLILNVAMSSYGYEPPSYNAKFKTDSLSSEKDKRDQKVKEDSDDEDDEDEDYEFEGIIPDAPPLKAPPRYRN